PPDLCRGAVAAQELAKRAIDRGLEGPLDAGLALEQDLFAEVFATEDARIGVASFLEHGPGKAAFVGREEPEEPGGGGPPRPGCAAPAHTGPPYAGPAYAGTAGQGAYGAYVPTPRFQALGGLATAATVLLGVMAVLALVGLGAHLNRVGLVEREF